MQLETVTAYCDWLNGKDGAGDPTGLGVNDILATFDATVLNPLDTSAPTPVDSIVDPYRDDNCAAFNTPNVMRALYVMPDGPVVAEGSAGQTNRKAASLAMTVRVIVRSARTAATWRWLEYVIRAIGMSTAAFNDDTTTAKAARTRAHITVVAANKVTYGTWNEAVGDATAIGIFALDFEVRDTRPRR
jgi:hypothetical protein